MNAFLRTTTALLIATTAAVALAGCASEKWESAPDPAIPRNALAVTQGPGRLFFRATDDGVVHLYDVDTARFVFSAPIRQGQRFIVAPRAAGTVVSPVEPVTEATVEGKRVWDQPLARNHTHRVYFEPFGKFKPPPKKAEEPAVIDVQPTTKPGAE